MCTLKLLNRGAIPVVLAVTSRLVEDTSQPCRRIFRSDISLRTSQHFESDHKLSNGRRAQQRRIKMRVHMPFGMFLSIRWTLVKTHGIWKRGVEKPVITTSEPAQNIGKRISLIGTEPRDIEDMALSDD